METAIWYWDAVLLSTTVIVAVPEEWVLIELYFLNMIVWGSWSPYTCHSSVRMSLNLVIMIFLALEA
jgi:hypothetical protein